MALWLRGAKQIVQVTANGELFLRGDAMKKLAVIESKNNEEGLSLIVDK